KVLGGPGTRTMHSFCRGCSGTANHLQQKLAGAADGHLKLHAPVSDSEPSAKILALTPALTAILANGSLLAGVEASAAQNAPVTKTCSQCGAVLPSKVRACAFCDFPVSEIPGSDSYAPANAQGNAVGSANDSGWRSELAHRMESYR